MFYSIPSKPERNRLRVYRSLQKAGTLSLKDGVHILPYSEDRYEFFVWLYQEIKLFDGDMNFVVVDKIEPLDNDDIVRLFREQSVESYTQVEQKIDEILNELSAKSNSVNDEDIYRQSLKKVIKEFESLKEIDFFKSKKISEISQKISSIEDILNKEESLIVQERDFSSFQNKKWQTRVKPFVDRMASAWLIKKFIDKNAEFIFSNSIDISNKDVITYDMNEATFTHIADLCTFEVMLKSFNINDERLNYIAKIVHILDLNDDKYIISEAQGIKLILSAIREQSNDDLEILLRSNEIFDYLYGFRKW